MMGEVCKSVFVRMEALESLHDLVHGGVLSNIPASGLGFADRAFWSVTNALSDAIPTERRNKARRERLVRG